MKIALLISGGDGSGINNFIYNLIRDSENEFIFFNDGINGLLENNYFKMSEKDILDYALSDFPILRTGRTKEKLVEEQYQKIKQNLDRLEIEGVILCGGDGSLKFLKELSNYGYKCFGIPMTVDNDVLDSTYTIGYPTALEGIKNDIIKIRNTSRALPNRIFILEVLGGYCGELALNSALISNADFVLIPEVNTDLKILSAEIKIRLDKQNSVVIVCSEGFGGEYTSGYQGIINKVSEVIEKNTGIRVRKTILGYSQRSGVPNTEELRKSQKLADYVKKIMMKEENVFIGLDDNDKAFSKKLEFVNKRTVNLKSESFLLAKDKKILL
ncbi:MAG: 6-phosphofructokinase [Fusobacteriaceae bacterium]